MHIADAETVICEILRSSSVPYRDGGQASLNAALARPMSAPYGVLQYKTPLLQAAALLDSINSRHPLYDGNKRTAWSLSLYFLTSRGYVIEEDQKIAATFVKDSIKHNFSLNQIALWFADRVV